MKKEIAFCFRGFILLFSLFVTFFGSAAPGFCFSEEFVDASGIRVAIKAPPSRVVSLVPTITEIIFRIGAGDVVGAITYHSTYPPETADKPIVGGFFSPSLSAIEAIQPDLIFLASFHRRVRERFSHSGCTLVNLDAKSVEDLYRNIDLLGKMFNKKEEARELKEQIKSLDNSDIANIADKVGDALQESYWMALEIILTGTLGIENHKKGETV